MDGVFTTVLGEQMLRAAICIMQRATNEENSSNTSSSVACAGVAPVAGTPEYQRPKPI